MVLRSIFVCSLLLKAGSSFSQDSYCPPRGYVPDRETAVKIAEAVWTPVYGKKIAAEKPYQARLIGDSVWVVTGTLHTDVGGTAYIQLRKKDCKVLKMIHGK